MTGIVHVEVSGLTGSGKSAIMGEIEIALKALGLKVEHGPDFQAEKNATHADWQEALDLYQPTVVLIERNVSRQPEAREEALGNLLAVIHGDGGHRALEVGTKQAALEAEKIVARLLSSAPEASEGEAVDHRPECWGSTSYSGEMAHCYCSQSTAAPSADKLRDVLVDLTSWFTKPVQGQSGMVWVIPAGERGADDALNAALAALKAEGKS